MELIERYVQAVAERLPEDTREDVVKELRANIEDMLPLEATEQDVRAVLEKMGNPTALANEYRQSKRYLIGPALYDTYTFVLKIVLSIAPIVFAFMGIAETMLRMATEPAGNAVEEYVAAVIGGAIEGAIMSFLWVTLVFAVLERIGVDEGSLPFGRKGWSVDDLPPAVPNPRSRIDRAGEVVAMIFILGFISVIVLRPELFGWYEKVDGVLEIIPVLNIDRLQAYIPALVALAAFGFALSAYKIVAGRWTLRVAEINALYNLAIVVLAGVALTDRSLFNEELITRLQEATDAPSADVVWNMGAAAIAAIILLCILDSALGFLKSKEVRLRDVPGKIWAWVGAER